MSTVLREGGAVSGHAGRVSRGRCGEGTGQSRVRREEGKPWCGKPQWVFRERGLEAKISSSSKHVAAPGRPVFGVL